MTNTMNLPATTDTGVACGFCSHWDNRVKVTIRHANVQDVLACGIARRQAPEAPVVNLDTVPTAQVIKHGRWVAVCRFPGCESRHEMGFPFTLKCDLHLDWESALVEADGLVRTKAAQLTATVTKTRCDGRCMHATGARCSCSCGGRNHGVGNMNVAAQPA